MPLCSFKRSGQPGPLTRLLSCTDEKLKAYKWLDIVPTFVVPDVEFDEEHQDHYTAYNKPFAVSAWLRVRPRTRPLVLSADFPYNFWGMHTHVSTVHVYPAQQ